MLLQGISVTRAIAIGKAYLLEEFDISNPPTVTSLDLEQEILLLRRAVAMACSQLQDIISSQEGTAAEILESHLNFAQDPAFNEDAESYIRSKHCSAHTAILDAIQELRGTFLQFDDAYMQERAADVYDVGTRILRCLLGEEETPLAQLPPGTIIVARDLAPSQTAQINPENVVGFVTETGGKTSHTAIMAKALGVAAVVGCKDALHNIKTGDTVVVNAVNGQVLVNPDDKLLARQHTLKEEFDAYLRMVNKVKDWQLIRENGLPVLVAANIGNPQQAAIAKERGADGIGLFRTEFLYMDRDEIPTENEQYEAFKHVAEIFGDAPVIIRTLDIGGDKSLPYLPIPPEENPFLGVRAIRLCMKYKNIFTSQLRALLRASVHGNLKIMFPMIGSMHELEDAKQLLEQCKQELTLEGVAYRKDIEIGMMIEVPAAALAADDFAQVVDFFSIGTNDLTQYTLAVDRGNPELANLYNSMHPSVLWLIQNTINAAHKHNIFCGMCGEMASDDAAIPLLATYGLDEYSVGLDAIGPTKCTLLAQGGITSPNNVQAT